jgi:hypothetical protein
VLEPDQHEMAMPSAVKAHSREAATTVVCVRNPQGTAPPPMRTKAPRPNSSAASGALSASQRTPASVARWWVR